MTTASNSSVYRSCCPPARTDVFPTRRHGITKGRYGTRGLQGVPNSLRYQRRRCWFNWQFVQRSGKRPSAGKSTPGPSVECAPVGAFSFGMTRGDGCLKGRSVALYVTVSPFVGSSRRGRKPEERPAVAAGNSGSFGGIQLTLEFNGCRQKAPSLGLGIA